MAGQRCQERRKIVIQGSLSLSYPMICCFLSVTARAKPAAILLLPCVLAFWYFRDFCEKQDCRVASLPAMTDKDQSQKHPTITFPLLRTVNDSARFLIGATGMEPESGGQEGVVKPGFRGASFACCPHGSVETAGRSAQFAKAATWLRQHLEAALCCSCRANQRIIGLLQNWRSER